MNSNPTIQLVAFLLIAACLLGNALGLTPAIDEQRKTLQLGFARTAGESLPPGAAGAVKLMGPLRGILISAWWQEVEQLKQEGDLARINQISRNITNVQPRFPEVWRYHAWNMAYNVSVTTQTPKERWDWVNKGIRLLRDEGIVYNPRSVKLYRELAWIFFHKVGQVSDDMHWYYKRRLCQEWQELLGALPEGLTTEQAQAEFGKIAEAPDTLAELLAAKPQVRQLLDEHIRGTAYDIEKGFPAQIRQKRENLLRAIGRVIMFNWATRLSELPLNIRPMPEHYDSNLLPMLSDPAKRPAVEELLAFLRKSVITENYHMDTKVMHEIMSDELFGPLDFRHPTAHGMYWAHLGIEIMKSRASSEKYDRLNNLRVRIHAAQDLMDSGKIIYDPFTDALDAMPDVRFIQSYENALNIAVDELRRHEQADEKAYQVGHENFLLKAMAYHYMFGDQVAARKYQQRSMELYGTLPDNLASGKYRKTLEDMVMDEWKIIAGNLEDTRALGVGFTSQALRFLAVGQRQAYERMLKAAMRIYAEYRSTQVATPISPQDRMAMRPLNELIQNTLLRMMMQPSPVESRLRLWRSAPLELQQPIYDRLKPVFAGHLEQAGYDPKVAFPEPPNMGPHRLSNPKPLPEDSDPWDLSKPQPPAKAPPLLQRPPG